MDINYAPWTLNSTTASAAGSTLVAAGALGIFVSTNSGSSWTTISSLPYGIASIALSADGTKLMAVSGQLILVSTDLGTTWAQTSAPATNWIALSSSADGSKLVAVAGGSLQVQYMFLKGPIYTSTNSGTTWTSNSVPVQYWTCVASSADGSELVAATAGDASTNTPGTTTGGGIWISQATPSPQLNITSLNDSLALSWIAPSTDFVLQQNSDPTTTNWMAVTDTPTLNLTNLQFEVTVSPTNSQGFYRLRTP